MLLTIGTLSRTQYSRCVCTYFHDTRLQLAAVLKLSQCISMPSCSWHVPLAPAAQRPTAGSHACAEHHTHTRTRVCTHDGRHQGGGALKPQASTEERPRQSTLVSPQRMQHTFHSSSQHLPYAGPDALPSRKKITQAVLCAVCVWVHSWGVSHATWRAHWPWYVQIETLRQQKWYRTLSLVSRCTLSVRA